MQWQGNALIINSQKFSDTSLIITLFSEDKGFFKSMARGGATVRKSQLYQIGNVISLNWKARFEDQLGSLSKVEIVTNYNSKFLNSKKKQLALKAITELISLATQIGEKNSQLYLDTIAFLNHIASNDLKLEDYITYELSLLKNIGFAIDMNNCAVTGAVDNLYYISPKTGHSVTKEVGIKYHDKLLVIPEFLKGKEGAEQDRKNAFKLTGYFFDKHLYRPYNKEIPFSRQLLEKEF